MAKVLVVINPFGGRDKGHTITDEEEIQKVLEGEHAHHVVVANHRDQEADQQEADQQGADQQEINQ